ncbi:MAG: 3'-5' exonuclease [Bacteroidales bacterium]|nr:3'-5' exonuclease [Bacteroidales bacterium]
MLSEIDLFRILFIDIETVPQYGAFDLVSDDLKVLWDKKSSYFRPDEQDASEVYSRAGIYAEFGKIICISAGILVKADNKNGLRIKSFYGDSEKEILKDFSDMLENYSKDKDIYLCAHNGKEFDFPYLSRRILINGLKLPVLLDNAGRKPWEIKNLDTMELWKFGDYKHYTSLDLLTSVFKIPSPKHDMDGSMVADVYWKDKNIRRIVEYCQNDVIAITQLLLRYKGEELITGDNISVVE